jgi:phosphatidylserine/phosphatidylglycerophosphate/cardiolipin synthase-like enzyme
VRAGHYTDGTASPAARSFDIAAGDLSIFDQYLRAIEAARSSIYIENQAFAVPEVVRALDAALARGIDVTVLVPADGNEDVRAARARPDRRAFFESLAALGAYERFTFAGIAGRDGEGRRHTVYIHAKIMLIDDAWATIGSCNVASRSFFGDTEMNATFWDRNVVRTLRCELLSEHLDADTSELDDRSAFALYREIARANRDKRDAGRGDWRGNAFALDPSAYGL